MNSETIERLSQFIDPHPNPREFALLNLAAIVSSSMYDLEKLVEEVKRMAVARENESICSETISNTTSYVA